jgi:hypothetical protein
VLALNLKGLAVDDVVVAAMNTLPTGERGVDDDLVAQLEADVRAAWATLVKRYFETKR